MSKFSSRASLLTSTAFAFTLMAAWVSTSTVGHSHGDVTPQAVDVEGLEALGEEFLEQNPYRLKGGEQYELAIKIGASGYNQNCARCHGLEAISGGIAPDLRLLEDGEFGDEWYNKYAGAAADCEQQVDARIKAYSGQ